MDERQKNQSKRPKNAAKQIESGIEEAWKGQVVKDGITYSVVTDVTVTDYATEKDATNSGSQNVIEMVKGPISRYADSEAGSGGLFTSQDAGRWNIDSMSKTIPAHEFGHLLGIDNKSGYVLMNTNTNQRHPTMTAQDFDWTFGDTVTQQRYDSQFESRFEWSGNSGGYRRFNTGVRKNSSETYTFKAPKTKWGWRSQ